MATYNALSTGGLLNGSNQQDTMNGSAVADQLNGLDGNDTIYGNAGDDTLNGGNGNDTLSGGTGNDIVSGGSGKDDMDGGDGIDTVTYASSTSGVAALFSATDGNGVGQQYTNKSAGGYSGDANGDTFQNFEIFVGTQYADVISGGTSQMTFYLGAGNDMFDTNAGISAVDIVYGEAGNDTIWGGPSADVLNGGDGNDTIFGEADNDTLTGGAGADVLDGGDGVDTVSYATAGAAVALSFSATGAEGIAGRYTNLAAGGYFGDAEGDTFSNVEVLIGSKYADWIGGSTAKPMTYWLGDGYDFYYSASASTIADEVHGGLGNDTISTGGGNDLVYGDEGDDTLQGDDGNDTLYGGDGSDILRGGNGDDLMEGGAGADRMNGNAGVDTVTYAASTAAVNANLTTGAGTGSSAEGDTYLDTENLVGSSFDDVLTGNQLVNRLEGGNGNDVLNGGAGADVLDGGAGTDTADYSTSAVGVTINLVTGVASDGDTLTSIENATGSAFNDVLVSVAGANVLNGGAGVDTADYSASATGLTINLAAGTASDGDTLVAIENVVGTAFNDVLVSAAGANVLNGGAGVDKADFSASATGLTISLAAGTASDGDTLVSIENATGSAFNDVFVSASGANVLNGGDGVDTAEYSAAAAGLTINLVNGTASDGDTLVSIENATGSAFNDVLVSAAGANVLNGGAGVDTADYSAAAAALLINLAAGTVSDGDTLLSVENATGSSFNDLFISAAGANVLNGGAGVDTVDYSGSNAAVTVNLESGNGLGGTAEGDSLVSIENVIGTQWADVLTGNADANKLEGLGGDDTLHGLAGNDQIFGGEGNDRIYGGEGADLIDGGAGTDTADYRYSAAGVTVSLVTNTGVGGDAQGDVLAGIENLAGSEFDDVLTGNDGVNRIVGGMGADKMYGMGGNDVFDTGGGYDFVDGGAGIDTVTYDDSWGAVVVNLATGTGSGAEAANDTYINVESVTGSLFGDKLTGDAGVNQLTGLDGNDILDGGAGNDYLVGGLGADTLIGGAGDQDVADYDDAASGVTVNLVTGGTGGEAAGDTYSGVEYVYGSNFNDVIVGNDAVNRLLGNDGNDVLDGGAGNDVLVGGAGADTLIGGLGDQDAASYQDAQLAVIVNLALGGTGGDAAGDTYNGVEYVYGSGFNDVIIGDNAINRLTGGAGNDNLDGAGGNDYLLGDAGNDVLTGGAGADVFVFNAGFGNDTITDFWAGLGRTDRAWFQGVTGVNNYNDVLSHAQDTAAGVLITVAAQGSLTLSGLTIAQLNADDFLFG